MNSSSSNPPPSSNPAASDVPGHSRRWLLGAAAATAGLLGAGTALWQAHGTQAPAPTAPPVAGLWSMRWDSPHGGAVAMQSFQGHPVLLNFWATWCPPCVEELPLLNRFYQQNKAAGWQVLGLAIDKLAPVQAFLQKTPLDFPVGLAALSGAELGHDLGNTAGSLPFSVVLGANGTVLQRKIGRLTASDLDAWLGLK